MEFWDLDGTLSIFRCLLIFLVLGGFRCRVGRSVEFWDFDDFSVFDDFLGIGWIFGHYQCTGGPELNFSARVDDAICGTIV